MINSDAKLRECLAIQSTRLIFEIVNSLKLVAVLLWLCVANSLCGQTTLVSNQAGLSQKKSQYRKALGQVGGSVYTVYSPNVDLSSGFVLEKYSQEMIFKLDRKVDVPNKHRVLKLVVGSSGIFWISVIRSKRQVNRYFYHQMDLDLTGDVKSKEIFSLDGIEVDIAEIESVVSKGKRAMCIFGLGLVSAVDKRKITTAFAFSVSDIGNLIDSFRGGLLADFGIDDVVWRSAEVSDFGNWVLVYEDKEAESGLFNTRKERGHFHVLYQINKQVRQQSISLVGLVRDVAVVLNTDKSGFELLGFWSEWKQTGLAGHFTGQLTLDSLELGQTAGFTFKQLQWGDREFKQMSGLASLKRSTKPENFFIRDAVQLSHGGWLILSEQFYENRQMETYYVNGVPQTSSKLFFHYGDIALIFLDGGGDLDSMILVRKSQTGPAAGTHLFGFSHYVCSKSVNFVFNDDEGEINRVMHVKIDNNFAMSKDWLFRSENIPGSIVPYEGDITEYCTLILPIYRDKQWHWLQVFSYD